MSENILNDISAHVDISLNLKVSIPKNIIEQGEIASIEYVKNQYKELINREISLTEMDIELDVGFEDEFRDH